MAIISEGKSNEFIINGTGSGDLDSEQTFQVLTTGYVVLSAHLTAVSDCSTIDNSWGVTYFTGLGGLAFNSGTFQTNPADFELTIPALSGGYFPDAITFVSQGAGTGQFKLRFNFPLSSSFRARVKFSVINKSAFNTNEFVELA